MQELKPTVLVATEHRPHFLEMYKTHKHTRTLARRTHVLCVGRSVGKAGGSTAAATCTGYLKTSERRCWLFGAQQHDLRPQQARRFHALNTDVCNVRNEINV